MEGNDGEFKLPVDWLHDTTIVEQLIITQLADIFINGMTFTYIATLFSYFWIV
jgi:hypothetical protein